jgi:vitamin-K-epoxide reductase (warfarin-sensitive)
MMRWLLLVLAVVGLGVSIAALREHYNTGTSPCRINDVWDCGVVNHSPYSVIAGVPVAAIGIGGYALLAVLAWKKAWRLLLAAALIGLVFSLYLTQIEANPNKLGVWCIYCVISLAMISLISVAGVAQVLVRRPKASEQESQLPG